MAEFFLTDSDFIASVLRADDVTAVASQRDVYGVWTITPFYDFLKGNPFRVSDRLYKALMLWDLV